MLQVEVRKQYLCCSKKWKQYLIVSVEFKFTKIATNQTIFFLQLSLRANGAPHHLVLLIPTPQKSAIIYFMKYSCFNMKMVWKNYGKSSESKLKLQCSNRPVHLEAESRSMIKAKYNHPVNMQMTEIPHNASYLSDTQNQRLRKVTKIKSLQ